MVRPAMGDDGVYGVEGAGVPGKWGWRVGLAGQYERSPVLVLTEGIISDRPVTDRVGGWAGFSLGLGRRIALQAVVPVAWQTGEDEVRSANGLGIGDPRLGARWGLLHTNLVDATIRADLYLPIGRQDAWMGEQSTRAAFGFSSALKGNFGAVLLDAGLVARPLEAPQPGLDWGPAVEFGLGVRADILPQFSVGGAWVGRAVLAGLDTKDGELASELLASARVEASPLVAITAGGGAGLQQGVGVPTFRAFATATFSDAFTQRKLTPAPVVAEVKRPPPDAKAILEEEVKGIDAPPPPPKPVPMARVEGDEIQIRDEIKFAEGSADLLPESHVIIVAIAELLAGDGRVAHLAIEGHASEEGSLVYNWDLSDRRARSVWEALVLEGVSPERMSWRGLGEVAPAEAGATEAAAKENRRVAMRITRRLAKGEALPATPENALLPWNGTTVALDTVVIPEIIVAPKEYVDPNFFQEEEE